ncbi:unnamed protein product [Didymodactylos carnosus]|uniref:Uncharacterized protein n=1 Tax=Didymodactylos carnosus TaxID=1234261 RepID=A0A813S3Z7_9BILA|nr:unnamed protein product [Didymodactylos carnosus]CAF0791883.1 unnamed protein product [Didymodactylos carnosus]CAF3492711.1 unnamed protein product [Didymodactylos carnosus]CAF3576086.1 unnamed protein product [Didymodactylos carnosus]
MYPHYFKRDINKLQIYIHRRKNRPVIDYKTLLRGTISLKVIQCPQSIDYIHLYMNSNEKKQQHYLTAVDNHNAQYYQTTSDVATELGQTTGIRSDKIKRWATTTTHTQQMMSIGSGQIEVDKNFGDYVDNDKNPSDIDDNNFAFGNEKKKFINPITAQSKQVTLVRVVFLGNDVFVNSFLQSYVECLASKPKEWMAYFRFDFIPVGASSSFELSGQQQLLDEVPLSIFS